MKFYIKFDIGKACKKILQEQLEKRELNFILTGLGEFELKDNLSKENLEDLVSCLNNYGIEVVENSKSILIQKIKDLIVELVYAEDKLTNSKISVYLADKLNHSYGYLSSLFSDVTYSSIENFIILQKTERAKQLITTNNLTFTEIAWKLNYSSVAHFSTQFKNATGLTPSTFQRIINKRGGSVKE